MTESGEQRPSSKPAARAARPRPTWSAGRVLAVIFAVIGGLIGIALLAGGIAVLAAFAFGRDDDGYFNSDRRQLDSATYAILTEDVDLGADEVDWAPDQILGNIRVEVEGRNPVFVGIGSDDDVERYLGGVARDELVDFDADTPELNTREGSAPPTPPREQDFWVAEAEGSGEQTLTWDAEFGSWTAVVMNADAARGIDVDAEVGIKLDWAIWPGLGALILGLLMTVGAVVVIFQGGRRGTRHPAS